jgi:hypothetical protein
LHFGDSTVLVGDFPDESFDAIVTDPPYGLGNRQPTAEDIAAYLEGQDLNHGRDFMGKPWQMPSVVFWQQCFRVLKPGAVVMAFAGTRTFDLMSAGLTAAGLQRVGCVGWIQAQGFPKSHNVGAGIDKLKGLKREIVGTKRGVGGDNLNDIVRGSEVVRTTTDAGGKGIGAYGVGAKQVAVDVPVTAPASLEAAQWEGWGTALKPAWEPILVYSKGPPSSFKMPLVPFFYTPKATKGEVTVGGTVEVTHPTKKPLALMRWLVQQAAPEGSLILDPYLGSGTTAVACQHEQRCYVGCELDPLYFQQAYQRIGIVRDSLEEQLDSEGLLDLMALLPPD